MNKKRILLASAAFVAVVAGIVGMSAFEAHVINVTAHIENALKVDAYGIDFGTVFPQEYLEEDFTISLSESFKAEERVESVAYKLVQKDKPWLDDFDGTPPEHRSLHWIDPDNNGSYSYADGWLTITTGSDVEDLFGPDETAGDWTAPRKMMRMGGNFTVETKVTANPNPYPGDSYQSGGILVYESNGNVVRLELTAFSGLGSTAVYMENQKNAVKIGKGWDSLSGANTVWLRLSRNGNTFEGEYSINGTTWQTVTKHEVFDFQNENIVNYPLVGVAVVDNKDGSSFSASFDYVAFNSGYLSLCRFLSKLKDPAEEDENDIGEPSYYRKGVDQVKDQCYTPQEKEVMQASGILSKTADLFDKWIVNLKVPPIAGYVGQDWPESCRQDWVVSAEADYGCDIWVEVTEITRID